MEIQVLIFLVSKIWVVLEIWADLVIWVGTKVLNSPLTDKTWVEWEEWIPVKYFKCLWEEEEDLEVLVILDKEESLLKKHLKLKEMVKVQKSLVDFLLMILILITLEVQDSVRLVKISSKKVNNKNDFLIYFIVGKSFFISLTLTKEK